MHIKNKKSPTLRFRLFSVKLIRSILGVLDVVTLGAIRNSKPDVLVFHRIVENGEVDESKLTVGKNRALHLMKNLCRHYDRFPWKCQKLIFTFDDGYIVPTQVLQFLRERRKKAIFFVNAGLLQELESEETPREYDDGPLFNLDPVQVMNWVELLEVKQLLPEIEVGDHNWFHVNLENHAIQDFIDGLLKSKSTFEAKGLLISSYAWPFGVMKPDQVPVLHQHNYQNLYLGSATKHLFLEPAIKKRITFRVQVDQENSSTLTVRGSFLLNRLLS